MSSEHVRAAWRRGRPFGAITLALAAVALAAPAVLRAEPAGEATGQARTWDSETQRLFATLPVQDGGRIKPLDTFAGFKLLKLNGKRSVRTEDGRTLTPVPWLLETLLYPERAKQHPTFLIENDEVLTAIGLSAAKKRDRYSYAALEPGLQRLEGLARQYSQIPSKDQGPVERQTLQLYQNVTEFEALLHFLDFARGEYPVHGSPGLQGIFPPGQPASLSDVLERGPAVRALWTRANSGGGDPAQENQAIQALVDRLMQAGQRAASVALFPPPPHDHDDHTGHHHPEEERWLSPFDLIQQSFGEAPLPEQHLALLEGLERLEATKDEPEAFKRQLGQVHEGLTGLAAAQGQYDAVPLEVFFYKGDFFYRALYLYLLGFVAVAAGWLWPKARWPVAGAWTFLSLATLLLTIGVTLRCVIRGRPPVTTLYETILFITGTSVMTALFLEWVNRRRIALAVAAVLGCAGLFLANRYEFTEAVQAGDTMGAMRAVLDTNFWLSTHVTTVTLGYAAGLLASALAHVWLGGKLLGLRKDDPGFYRDLARMVYGVIGFSVIFSTVGTILGGIWANDSWGRFWGWDPKENGALMIVLWQLVMLHARLGGYIKAYGLCVLAVLGGLVVAFSWWGVNLLGVGLHSYGFTHGAQLALNVAYGAELAFVLATVGWWLSQRGGAATASSAAE